MPPNTTIYLLGELDSEEVLKMHFLKVFALTASSLCAPTSKREPFSNFQSNYPILGLGAGGWRGLHFHCLEFMQICLKGLRAVEA